MKHFLRTVGTLGVVGIGVYLFRDRLLPPPVIEPAPAPIRGAPVAGPKPAPAVTPTPKPAPPADDLTVIVGIGRVYAARLNAQGITSFGRLADGDPGPIAAAVGTGEGAVTDWIEQARRLRSS